MGSAPRYNPKQLNAALSLMLAAAEAAPATLKQSKNLRVDIVDLAQSLMGNAYIIHLDAMNASLREPAPAPPAPPALPQMCEDMDNSSCAACTGYTDKRCPGKWCGPCIKLSSPCSNCAGQTCMPAHWWGAPGNYGKTASPDITCTGNATGCNHTCTGGGGGGGGIGGASAVTVRSVNYNVQQDSPPGLDDMDNGVASSTTTPVQVLQQPPSPTEIQAAGVRSSQVWQPPMSCSPPTSTTCWGDGSPLRRQWGPTTTRRS